MVKRREPKASAANILKPQLTEEKIEEFAAGAENAHPKALVKIEPDEDAIRDFKAIRVPFNQYEYEQLVKASKLSGRTKLNFMRYAMLKLAKEMQE